MKTIVKVDFSFYNGFFVFVGTRRTVSADNINVASVLFLSSEMEKVNLDKSLFPCYTIHRTHRYIEILCKEV